jgi:hypothetical protein
MILSSTLLVQGTDLDVNDMLMRVSTRWVGADVLICIPEYK